MRCTSVPIHLPGLIAGSLVLGSWPVSARAQDAVAAEAEPIVSPSKQRIAWGLSPGAFVEFERKRKIEMKGDRKILTFGPTPAAAFYEWELEDGTQLFWRSSSLLGLIPQLALSVSGWTPRTAARFRIARYFRNVYKFGSIRATGAVLTRDISDPRAVRESATIELRSSEPEVPFNVERNWDKKLLFGQFDVVDTQLEFSRSVDAVLGRVTGFQATLSGVVRDRRKNPRRWDFRVEEAWRLVDIQDHRGRGFQRRVNKAIATGCAHLEKELGKWLKQATMSGKADQRGHTYGTGRLALVLLTLEKGNPDRGDETIQKLIAALRRRRPLDTYSLGIALMALEGYYAPPNEAEQLRQGLIDKPRRRTLPASDLAIIQRWVDRLLRNRDTRIDRGYRLRFNYVPGRRYDNSNTQYGVLGLYSAGLCGAKIPLTAWLGLAEHFLECQSRDEGKQPLRLTSYGQLERQERARAARSTVARVRPHKVPVRGYGYSNPTRPTGSMTTAGATGLGICRAMLGTLPKKQRPILVKADEARLGAFAWLRENYDLRHNPRHSSDRWFYYYLYGLERACEINGVARLDGRDWYFDGAMQLLATQRKNGSWGSLQDTCFAILFLKKAVAPVLTGR